MIKYYAVMYNKVFPAGVDSMSGLVAVFAKEEKAQAFCMGKNYIERGFTVEAVRIVKVKKEKKS